MSSGQQSLGTICLSGGVFSQDPPCCKPYVGASILCAANSMMRQLTPSSSASASASTCTCTCTCTASSVLVLRTRTRPGCHSDFPSVRQMKIQWHALTLRHTQTHAHTSAASAIFCQLRRTFAGELLGKKMRKAQNHYDLNAIKCVFSFRIWALSRGQPMRFSGYCVLSRKVSLKMSFLVDI